MSQPSAPRQPPRVFVVADPTEASDKVAQWFADAIRANPEIVLGMATGGTPVGCYRELIRMHRQDGLSFSAVTTFNLDEYVGLAGDHPQSFRAFMQSQLFDHIDIQRSMTHVPDGIATDLGNHAVEYERAIRAAGGIDLQLLGIGRNGHIAFNEPGSAADSRTRIVSLTPSTIESNSRFFERPDQVPRQAITMGIGTILETKQIVLLATGADKADAVAAAIEGPISPSNPASLLRNHPDVIFVLDHDAASQLASIRGIA